MQKKLYLCSMKVRWGILLSIVVAVGVMLTGCSPRALREAQEVVAEADSLRTEGVPYTDSVTMAEAYNTLDKWQYLYPTDYARACYYYGRLLRNNDDPVAAMQVFINATHTNTRDYHILGRIYSNMANICRLNNSHDLAYTLHSRSAEMFSQAGDTLLYYYGLHNMAYECATLGEKQESLSLIRQIQQQCTDSNVLLLSYETTAEMYRILEMYDSAIYWINQANMYGDIGSYGSIIKAQSFNQCGISDSATYYATQILTDPTAPYHARFNALYIISHNDSTLSKDSALTIASAREDIRYYEYEPEKEKMVAAVNLLTQDLENHPDWKWIYVLIGIITLLGGIIGFSHAYRRFRLIKKNDEKMRATIEQKCDALNSLSDKQLQDTIYWRDFNSLCHFMNGHMNGVISKLLQVNSHLTEQNIRLCIVTIIGCSYNRSAEMLRLSKTSISKSKQIVADKLGTDIKSLRSCLLEISYKN